MTPVAEKEIIKLPSDQDISGQNFRRGRNRRRDGSVAIRSFNHDQRQIRQIA